MGEATESGVTPCRWWLWRDAVPAVDPVLISKLPGAWWSGWEARYDNDVERGKRSLRDPYALPPVFAEILTRMQSDSWLRRVSGLLGYEVENDPSLHGGGLHVTDPGGYLGTHLDYAAHPFLPGKERRVNLIAFLNPVWRKEWGGELRLCDPLGRVVKQFLPEPGLVVGFETGDESYHGVNPILKDEKGLVPPRVTTAVYYLSDLRPGVTRQRALFMPSRSQ